MRDKKLYEEDKLYETEHIYCKFDESNISNVRAMIVGPKDSSYEGGFYFIYIKLPQQYPFVSPQAKYCTQYNNFRFHPNLYVNGKMCLSILDRQWAGPPWTPVMGIKSLLITTKSILDDNPLANEPGFSNSTPEKSEKHRLYRDAVRYMNIMGGTINAIKNPPAGFNDFVPDMKKYFIENYENYVKFVDDKLKPIDGKIVGTQSYSRHDILINVNDVKKQLKKTLEYCKK